MNERHAFAVEAVREAGRLLLETRSFDVHEKKGDPRNVVTSADYAVQEFLLARLTETYPGEPVYSEERQDNAGISSGKLWTIDPIDGSSNFSRGIPHFAVCLGLLEQGEPVTGAVYNPATDELFSFEKGSGAYLNGSPIRVSSVTELKDAFVLFHAGRDPSLWEWGGSSYRKLLERAKKTSNLASSSLDACFVAAGRVEANIYGMLSTLDIAPAIGILREAGGVITVEHEGLQAAPQKVIMANNPKILEALSRIL